MPVTADGDLIVLPPAILDRLLRLYTGRPADRPDDNCLAARIRPALSRGIGLVIRRSRVHPVGCYHQQRIILRLPRGRLRLPLRRVGRRSFLATLGHDNRLGARRRRRRRRVISYPIYSRYDTSFKRATTAPRRKSRRSGARGPRSRSRPKKELEFRVKSAVSARVRWSGPTRPDSARSLSAAGVYIFVRGGRPYYVGLSSSLGSRIGDQLLQIRRWSPDADIERSLTVYTGTVTPATRDHLRLVEASLVAQLRPPKNRNYLTRGFLVPEGKTVRIKHAGSIPTFLLKAPGMGSDAVFRLRGDGRVFPFPIRGGGRGGQGKTVP